MGIRIGVVSDTHLKQVTKEFKEIFDKHLSDKDVILHAGDVVSAEVVDFLSAKDFHGVSGNMDPLEVKEILPVKKVVELGKYQLGLIHGWGPPFDLENRIWPEFNGVDIIIYGHSHQPANHIREGVLFFNPGSASGITSSGTSTIGVLELDDHIHGEIIML